SSLEPAQCRQPNRHELDDVVRVRIRETLLVGGVEGIPRGAERRGVDLVAGPRNGQLERLAFVSEVDGKAVLAIAWRYAIGQKLLLALPSDRVHQLTERRQCCLIERHHAAAGKVVRDIRVQNAPGGKRAGIRRKDDALDAELIGNGTGVNRTCAAEGKYRKVPWIEPLLEQREPDGGSGTGVRDGYDPAGRRLCFEAEWPGELFLDRPSRTLQIERHRSAQKIFRIEAAEHQVGVGDGRLAAAAPVADWTRVRAGALGSDRDALRGVDPRDGAAAGADRANLDHRHPHGQPVDLPLGDDLYPVIVDDG